MRRDLTFHGRALRPLRPTEARDAAGIRFALQQLKYKFVLFQGIAAMGVESIGTGMLSINHVTQAGL